jgi:hypothetical protein
MSRRSARPASPRIEQLRHRIEQWRESRPHLGPMPEPLWAAAVDVAREHGVYGAAHRLGVSYDSLKARMGKRARRLPRAKARPSSPAAFVEIGSPAPFAHGAGGASVELTEGDGARLAIHLPAGEAVDLVELVREFWGRRA